MPFRQVVIPLLGGAAGLRLDPWRWHTFPTYYVMERDKGMAETVAPHAVGVRDRRVQVFFALNRRHALDLTYRIDREPRAC
jgi:hypothetical protein